MNHENCRYWVCFVGGPLDGHRIEDPGTKGAEPLLRDGVPPTVLLYDDKVKGGAWVDSVIGAQWRQQLPRLAYEFDEEITAFHGNRHPDHRLYYLFNRKLSTSKEDPRDWPIRPVGA